MKSVAAVVALSLTVAAQSTLTVPAQYPTIQAAIDAAVAGDTVLVDPGTYCETINFGGKDITVRSVSGPAWTIIDANDTGTVVSFISGETSAAVLAGDPLFGGTLDATGAFSYTIPGLGALPFLSGQTFWGMGIQQLPSGVYEPSNIASITF